MSRMCHPSYEACVFPYPHLGAISVSCISHKNFNLTTQYFLMFLNFKEPSQPRRWQLCSVSVPPYSPPSTHHRRTMPNPRKPSRPTKPPCQRNPPQRTLPRPTPPPLQTTRPNPATSIPTPACYTLMPAARTRKTIEESESRCSAVWYDQNATGEDDNPICAEWSNYYCCVDVTTVFDKKPQPFKCTPVKWKTYT